MRSDRLTGLAFESIPEEGRWNPKLERMLDDEEFANETDALDLTEDQVAGGPRVCGAGPVPQETEKRTRS